MSQLMVVARNGELSIQLHWHPELSQVEGAPEHKPGVTLPGTTHTPSKTGVRDLSIFYMRFFNLIENTA